MQHDPDLSEAARASASHLPLSKQEELASSIVLPRGDEEPGETVLILDRARAGDKRAVGELYERYHERLRKYARIELRARRGADPEDIVQDAYVKLIKNLERFEYRGKDSLYAYLKRVAYHAIVSEARLKDNQKMVMGDAAEIEFMRQYDGMPTPSMIARSFELQQILEESMAELPEQLREVLLNRQVIEAPSRLVALWMGLADQHAVDKLLYKARIRWLAIAEPRLKAWLAQT